ncbi:serine hydrolase [Spirosoma flavum]|uniref:Serine hydrolase n=1 Tax=Spirosoma flavum TaxID=2048557 RepID=A0ABW6ALP9_9BACT
MTFHSPRLTLLLLPGLLMLTGADALTQPPKRLADRIAAVENSLLPYVPVEGLKGWSLQERMRYHGVPGVSVAVIHNYRVDWVKSYGLADTTNHRPVTNGTMFSAGSISKLVAAMAALKLVEQGKMDLETPINKYLSSWKLTDNDFTRKTPVTLRMLLSHRGGTSQSAYFGFTPDKKPLPSVVDILSGKPGTDSRAVVVNSEPSKEFRYSGGGYLVAQMAMMDVAGKDFATFTNETIFKPLGLRRTTFEQPLPPALAPYLSWAYSTNGWFKGMPYVYPQQAAAGLHTTAGDLAKIIIDLQNSYRDKGGVLNQASVKDMMTPLALVSDGFIKEQIGLGAFLLQTTNQADEASRYFNHSGSNAGFIADATGSLVNGNGLVVMMNDNNGANELGKEIRRAVAQVYGWRGFLPKPLTTCILPDSLLEAYVGRYQRSADEVVTFRRKGNLLIEKINNGNDIICVPTGRDTIAFTDYTAKAYFSRGKTGRVDSVRVEWQKTPMPRLAEGVYLPNELIRMGRIAEAMDGYRAMSLTVYQLTYMAYDFVSNRPANLPAAEGVLELAKQRYPKEGIVYARYGDLYQKQGNKTKAIAAYQTALQLDPADQDSKDKLTTLLGH